MPAGLTEVSYLAWWWTEPNRKDAWRQQVSNFHNAQNKWRIKEKQVLLWYENMKSALSKAVVAAGKIKMIAHAADAQEKLDAAIDAYNKAIPGGAGRDVCMQLVIAKHVEDLRASPDQPYGRMIAWNTDQHHALQRGASAKDILDKVTAFTADIKFTVQDAGVYNFLCFQRGHADRGQKGTFTVAKS